MLLLFEFNGVDSEVLTGFNGDRGEVTIGLNLFAEAMEDFFRLDGDAFDTGDLLGEKGCTQTLAEVTVDMFSGVNVNKFSESL